MSSLAQTPLRSPSVFNFYRPGYVPPGSVSAAANLVAPELQILGDVSAAGYVNYVRDSIGGGAGSSYNPYIRVNGSRRDLQASFTAELALADRPVDLVQQLNRKLTYGSMSAGLKTAIQDAVATIVIPALNSGGSNQAAIDTAKRARVNAAIFLTLVSPEFQLQK